MQVLVRLFASLREEVGRETVALEVGNPARRRTAFPK